MNKVEFSDVYKFAASIGLIAIGLAVLFPWFISQENKIVLIESEKIKTLTQTAQKIIIQQQDTLLFLNNNLLQISIVLISMGLLLLIWSIYRWSQRQKVVDAMQDQDLITKQFSNISISEKRNNIEIALESSAETTHISNETVTIIDGSSDINISHQSSVSNENIDNYIKIEDKIFERLSLLQGISFTAFQNIKFGQANIDILLKSIVNERDLLYQILIYKNKINKERVKNAAFHLAITCNTYTNLSPRNPVGIIIIVYSGLESKSELKEIKDQGEHIGRKSGQRIIIKYLKHEEVDDFNPVTFRYSHIE